MINLIALGMIMEQVIAFIQILIEALMVIVKKKLKLLLN
jgi:hypothetical protein